MKTADLSSGRDVLDGLLPRPSAWLGAARPARGEVEHAAAFALALLDVVIGLGRKLGGFGALLVLALMFVRLILLGQTPRELYPDAADPALRATFMTALLLVLAQGWDVAPERLAADWARLCAFLPVAGATARRAASLPTGATRAARRLAALLDAGVAASNKAGALGAFASLLWVGLRLASGTTLHALYPGAVDPALSLAADLAVDLIVLGWWSTSFAEIAAPWRRFRRTP